jgi:hypothetical protein
VYTYGNESSITIHTNTGGPVKLLLDREISLEGSVLAPGETWSEGWEFVGMPPEDHALSAVLMSSEGDVLDEDTCSFTLLPACADFENLPLGSSYTDGESFTSGGVTILVLDGSVTVEDAGDVGVGNGIFFLYAELAEFIFDRPPSGLSLRYSHEADYPAYVRFEINDESEDLDSMEEFNGHTIGDVQITAQDGLLRLDGTINFLTIGVTELYIDDACIW